MVEAVRTRRDFSTLSRSRTRARSGPVWIVRADTPVDPGHVDPGHAVHVAYAIGRPVGGAVVRNRVRRRLRSVVSQLDRSQTLRPGLYLIGAKPAAADASFRELGVHLEQAVAELS